MKPVVVVDKLMDTVSRLFFEQGYNLTGINQILAESKVSKPSMYVHFRSKKDLLLAYLDQLHEKWFAGLEEFTTPLTDPKDRLLAIFDYRIDRQIKSNFGGCAWTKISAEVPKDDKEVFEKVLRFKKELKAYILDLVLQVDTSANCPLTDELLAENIFLLLEGAQVMACVSKTAKALIDSKEIIQKLL